MKLIKIGNKEYAIKYNTKTIKEMNRQNITFKTLSEEMESDFNTNKLYDAFYYGLKTMNDVDKDDVDEIIDEFFEKKTLEDLFELVLGEMANAMGFYPMFKKQMKEAKLKKEKM